MLRRLWLAAIIVLGITGPAVAQGVAAADDGTAAWRQANNSPPGTSAKPRCHASVIAIAESASAGQVGSLSSNKPATRVTGGSGTLPNDAGQVWREYDISPYTTRVTTTKRPEQAIIDWILRETGYEAWHTEPLGILSAGPRTLRVYHTPKMQEIVADLVDRFVSSEAATLHVLPAGRDARQSQLAYGGPAVDAPGAGANAQRQRLAAGQGGRGHSVGPTAPPQRLPRTQLALPDGQQRAIDVGHRDARPAVRPRRDPPSRNARRLRSLAGPGR